MSKTPEQLQSIIMKRVYYAYALRVATHPLWVKAVLLVASVFALSKLIHVASIINNISNLRVGDLGRYMVNTFANAEFFTLVLVAVIFYLLISLPLSLKTLKIGNKMERMQTL